MAVSARDKLVFREWALVRAGRLDQSRAAVRTWPDGSTSLIAGPEDRCALVVITSPGPAVAVVAVGTIDDAEAAVVRWGDGDGVDFRRDHQPLLIEIHRTIEFFKPVFGSVLIGYACSGPEFVLLAHDGRECLVYRGTEQLRLVVAARLETLPRVLNLDEIERRETERKSRGRAAPGATPRRRPAGPRHPPTTTAAIRREWERIFGDASSTAEERAWAAEVVPLAFDQIVRMAQEAAANAEERRAIPLMRGVLEMLHEAGLGARSTATAAYKRLRAAGRAAWISVREFVTTCRLISRVAPGLITRCPNPKDWHFQCVGLDNPHMPGHAVVCKLAATGAGAGASARSKPAAPEAPRRDASRPEPGAPPSAPEPAVAEPEVAEVVPDEVVAEEAPPEAPEPPAPQPPQPDAAPPEPGVAAVSEDVEPDEVEADPPSGEHVLVDEEDALTPREQALYDLVVRILGDTAEAAVPEAEPDVAAAAAVEPEVTEVVPWVGDPSGECEQAVAEEELAVAREPTARAASQPDAAPPEPETAEVVAEVVVADEGAELAVVSESATKERPEPPTPAAVVKRPPLSLLPPIVEPRLVVANQLPSEDELAFVDLAQSLLDGAASEVEGAEPAAPPREVVDLASLIARPGARRTEDVGIRPARAPMASTSVIVACATATEPRPPSAPSTAPAAPNVAPVGRRPPPTIRPPLASSSAALDPLERMGRTMGPRGPPAPATR